MAIGGKVISMSDARYKWGGNMKVGDLVQHVNNKEIFVVVGKSVRKGTIRNTDIVHLLDHRGVRKVDVDFLEVING